MKHDELLHKWFNDQLSEEELEIFSKREEYDSLLKLKQNVDSLQGPDFDFEQMLQNILKKKKQALHTSKASLTEVKVKKDKARLRLWPLTMAASLLFLLGYFFISQPSNHSYQSYNESIVEFLPDQSKFELFPKSKLSYDKNKWAQNRSLLLKGAAKFEVVKGSNFKVNTDLGLVEVLGTIFTVYSNESALLVNCDEGTVMVEASQKILFKEKLNMGESLEYYRDGKSIVRQSNMTKCKNLMLSAVLKEIESQFKIPIDANNIDLTVITSCNFKHDNLNQALKTTLSPLGVKYKNVDGKVSLSK